MYTLFNKSPFSRVGCAGAGAGGLTPEPFLRVITAENAILVTLDRKILVVNVKLSGSSSSGTQYRNREMEPHSFAGGEREKVNRLRTQEKSAFDSCHCS